MYGHIGFHEILCYAEFQGRNDIAPGNLLIYLEYDTEAGLWKYIYD